MYYLGALLWLDVSGCSKESQELKNMLVFLIKTPYYIWKNMYYLEPVKVACPLF